MQADYVIVGAGSAGCAMAFRLSEAGHSVIVIEFGGSDAGPLIQMPGALSYPMNMLRYDWGYWSEPEPYLGGRQLACPRGKVSQTFCRQRSGSEGAWHRHRPGYFLPTFYCQ